MLCGAKPVRPNRSSLPCRLRTVRARSRSPSRWASTRSRRRRCTSSRRAWWHRWRCSGRARAADTPRRPPLTHSSPRASPHVPKGLSAPRFSCCRATLSSFPFPTCDPDAVAWEPSRARAAGASQTRMRAILALGSRRARDLDPGDGLIGEVERERTLRQGHAPPRREARRASVDRRNARGRGCAVAADLDLDLSRRSAERAKGRREDVEGPPAGTAARAHPEAARRIVAATGTRSLAGCGLERAHHPPGRLLLSLGGRRCPSRRDEVDRSWSDRCWRRRGRRAPSRSSFRRRRPRLRSSRDGDRAHPQTRSTRR